MHELERAFTLNMMDPRRYMVTWSNTLSCFIRWTWWYPTRNEVIG